MKKAIEDRRAFIINFIYFGIFVALFYFTVNYAMGYIFPFAFAAVLSVLLQPFLRKISEKLHIKAHGFISTVLVLLIVVLIVGILVGAITAIVSEVSELVSVFITRFDSLSDIVVFVEDWANGVIAKLPERVAVTVNETVSNFFTKVKGNNFDIDFSILSTPLSGAWDVVKGVPSFFISIIVTIISCVFVTSEYDFIRDMILGMVSEKKGKKIIEAKKTVVQGLGKIIKAYVTIMLITFTEVFIGLNIMKAIGISEGNYIVIIALITCIVDIVPVLGTGTVMLPWAVYNIIVGDIAQGIGLIILYAVITVLRQIIEPKLVANQAGLPAIVTIMAMFLGARLFGAFGIILLPLTVIIVKLMYDEGIIGARSHEEADCQPSEECSLEKAGVNDAE